MRSDWRISARCSESRRANSSGWCSKCIWFIGVPPLARFEAVERLIDVDLPTRDLLHQLDPRQSRLGGLLFDAELAEQCVEAGTRRRVADPEVALEVLHVAA